MTEQIRDQLQATLGAAYTLERELGGGGMSRVFVAEENALRRKVVVKVLPPELTAGVNVERFNREILLAAKLQHPHIVPVLAAGETQGLPYYTMPLVEGESLRARLGRGPLTVTDTVGVLRDVAKALAYAHERGIVHRDIKPDNVLLTGGSATVTDFGIAKAISASRTHGAGETLTQIGTSIGTPTYMSPEQAAGDPDTDHRTDIYSFGCMAYELLAGQPPFVEKTPRKLLAAHMGEKPRALGELRPDVPPALADLVMRCLEKEAEERPQHATDLVRVLETVTSSGSSAAMPSVLLGGAGMFRKALAIYAAAFVAVAILAKAAIVGIGLPDWVFPGSLIVMALGLPVVLWTGYVQRVTRRAMTMTPTYTPGGSPSTTAHGTIATIALKAAPHVSWYRTARGGIYAFGAFIAMTAAFMVMRALGIGPAATLFSAGALTEKERILLTDFSVTSGDTSLARVVSFAVRTALSQSPVLTIVDQPAVAAALERMDRPRTSRVDLPLAQGVAIREGIKAIVDGEVTPVSSGYVLTLRLVSSDSLHLLTSFQATGDGPQGLIAAADKVARELRAKAGESLRTVQRALPLARARTSSLEALRKYSEGYFANTVEIDRPKALRLLREAVAIDTGFAEAYRTLWAALAGNGAPVFESDSALTRAFQLRERLPEVERLNIEGAYYSYTPGFQGPGRDRARSIAAYERVLALGMPGSLRNNLAIQYGQRREFARAESLFRADIATDSNSLLVYGNILGSLVAQGKSNAADSVVNAMLRRFPRAAVPRRSAVGRLYLEGRLDEMQKALDSARAHRDPTDPAWAPWTAASLALLRGRVNDWRQLRSQALTADSTVGRRPSRIADAIAKAEVQAIVRGDQAGAAATLDAATAGSSWKNVPEVEREDLEMALAFAQVGQPAKARAVLAAYESSVRDSSLRRVHEPDVHAIKAEVALREHRPAEAIDEYRLGDRLADGPVNACTICLPIQLARAFDAANRPDSAIANYELYVNQPAGGYRLNVQELDPITLPVAHERLGQLYEAKGDAAKAAEHYRVFIDLWKNADPELQPRVAEARRRLAKLSPVEGKRP